MTSIRNQALLLICYIGSKWSLLVCLPNKHVQTNPSIGYFHTILRSSIDIHPRWTFYIFGPLYRNICCPRWLQQNLRRYSTNVCSLGEKSQQKIKLILTTTFWYFWVINVSSFVFVYWPFILLQYQSINIDTTQTLVRCWQFANIGSTYLHKFLDVIGGLSMKVLKDRPYDRGQRKNEFRNWLQFLNV